MLNLVRRPHLKQNPYQSSSVVHEMNSIVSRPMWIYFYTAASSLTMASLPIVFGWMAFRFYRVFLSEFFLLWIGVIALAVMSGVISGWRTWTRLTRVHSLRLQVEKNRADALSELTAMKDFQSEVPKDSKG